MVCFFKTQIFISGNIIEKKVDVPLYWREIKTYRAAIIVFIVAPIPNVICRWLKKFQRSTD